MQTDIRPPLGRTSQRNNWTLAASARSRFGLATRLPRYRGNYVVIPGSSLVTSVTGNPARPRASLTLRTAES